MNRSHLFQGDDDDDSKLFRKAEEYVLKNCPNPDRVGCPGPAVLRAFVDSPEETSLRDICGLHILRCAECTRDLKGLRKEREHRLRVEIRQPKGQCWKRLLLSLAVMSMLIGILFLYWFSLHRS